MLSARSLFHPNHDEATPLQLVVDVSALASLWIRHAGRRRKAPVDQHLDVGHAREDRVEVAEQIGTIPSHHDDHPRHPPSRRKAFHPAHTASRKAAQVSRFSELAPKMLTQ